MRPRIIKERVSAIEESPLSNDDQKLLKKGIQTQLDIFVPAYVAIVLISLYMWVEGPDSINTGRDAWNQIQITPEVENNFWTAAPYVCSFIFLMATIFFLKYYLQTVRPVLRDLKNRKKKLVFFRPEKTDMSAFNRYYLTIPLSKDQLVEITQEDFFLINDAGLLCLEIGPDSQYILRLMYHGKEIKFFRKI